MKGIGERNNMEEWKEYKISDIIEDISMGPFGSNIKVENFCIFGIPVLNGSNLQGIKLKEKSFNFVTEEKANSLGKANARRGDIVVTHRGTLGQIVYIPQTSKYDRYVISQSQFRLRLKDKLVRPDFFTYFFHTRLGQHKILVNVSQVGVPALARPTSTFKDVIIPVPSMKIQDKIMKIIQPLDDKIELNNRINANLEEQAQAIFRRWFVDFEFPNEQGLPYKSNGGKFIDSELGRIPKEWKVGTLSDIADIIMGQSPSGESYNENGEGKVFYQGRTDFGNRFPSRRLFTTEPKRMAEEKSVLLSVRAPVGDINIAIEKCCIGRGLASIKAKNDFYSFLLYTMLNLKDKLNLFNGEGTVFGSINKTSLESIHIVKPNLLTVQSFEFLIKDFDRQIKRNYYEIVSLEQLRDVLLPKLMNNEIKL